MRLDLGRQREVTRPRRFFPYKITRTSTDLCPCTHEGGGSGSPHRASCRPVIPYGR
jgi:hypothetical protein